MRSGWRSSGTRTGLKYEQAPKLVALAEKYPKDPIALDALTEAVWQVNTVPWPVELVGRDDARPRAFALLQRDHIRSDKLGPLCERISYGFCKEYETFLRAVLEKNPHQEVRAQACLALAHFLNNRSQRLDLVREQPELARSSRTSTARSTSKDCGGRTAPRPSGRPKPSLCGPRGTMAT